MHVIRARNAHQALPEVLYQLNKYGVRSDSRNGPVLRFPGPCTIVYERPLERVVFWPQRDANPFFHLLESIWMLAGRDDVAFPASIVASMSQFSDDGQTYNGAYGKRWRSWFGADQLLVIAAALRANPDDRRQVMTMWDARHDPQAAASGTRDVPCNTQVYFAVNDGCLDMTVLNRSNDIVWGALGANAVHFSVLLEVMAVLSGYEIGRYWQVSNNMHLYVDRHANLLSDPGLIAAAEEHRTSPSGRLVPAYRVECPYESGLVKPIRLVQEDAETFLRECSMLIDGPAMGITQHGLRRVAGLMLSAVRTYKTDQSKDRWYNAMAVLSQMPDCDWRRAGSEWLLRRYKAAEEKEAERVEG